MGTNPWERIRGNEPGTTVRGAIRHNHCWLSVLLPGSHIGGGLHTHSLQQHCSPNIPSNLRSNVCRTPTDSPHHPVVIGLYRPASWFPGDTADSCQALILNRTVAPPGPPLRSVPSAVAVAIRRGRCHPLWPMPPAVADAIRCGRFRHPVRADRRLHRAAEHHPVDLCTRCRPLRSEYPPEP